MERLKRYSKQIIALLCAFVMLVGGVLSTSFDSKAASNYVFYLNYPEPAVSETQGYLQVLLRNSYTGEYNISTFFWNTVGSTSSGEQVPVLAEINVGTESLTFNLISNLSSVTNVYYNLYEITVTPRYSLRAAKSTGSTTYRYADSGWYAQAWKCNGNATVTGIANNINFDAYFSSAGYAEFLEQIVGLLGQENATLSSILVTVTNILNSIGENFDISNEKSEVLSQKQEEQKETLGALNDKNNVDKVDISSSSGDTDSYLDSTSINNYGTVLAVFTNNSYILSCILFVLSVGLVSYVLFGKKR